MRKYILLLIGLMFFASCENEGNQSNPQLCADEYFYYSGGSKVFLKHSLNEIWIEFGESDVTGEIAKSILNKYSFINADNFSADSYYGSFKAILMKSVIAKTSKTT